MDKTMKFLGSVIQTITNIFIHAFKPLTDPQSPILNPLSHGVVRPEDAIYSVIGDSRFVTRKARFTMSHARLTVRASVLAMAAALSAPSLIPSPQSLLQAAVPQSVVYQGKLSDPSGNVKNGSFDFRIKLYDASTSGTLLLTDEQTAVGVTNGVYTLSLGQGTLTPGSASTLSGALSGSSVYLEIEVKANGDPSYEILSPRIRLESSPYALRAEKAEQVSLESGDFTLTIAGTELLRVSSSSTIVKNVLDLQSNRLINLASPSLSGDAATKGYADTKLSAAGGTMTGDLQIGEAGASTFSASGYLTLASLNPASVSPSQGRLFFDSTAGALKVSLDGSAFVPISTGTAGAGLSAVSANTQQFSGDGTSGNALTLLASSVTLLGPSVDFAELSFVPALQSDLSNETSARLALATSVASDTTTIKTSVDSNAGQTSANAAQLTQVASDTTTLKTSVDSAAGQASANAAQLTQVASDTTTLKTSVDSAAGQASANATRLTQVASDTTTLKTELTAETSARGTLATAVAADTTTLKTELTAESAARSTLATAVASDTTTLKTSVDAAAGQASANAARLTQVATDTTTIQGSLSGEIAARAALATAVASDTTTLKADITNEAAARSSLATAVASDTTTLKASVDSASSQSSANAVQLTQVASDTTTLKTGIDANAARLTQVASDTTTLKTDIDSKVSKSGDSMNGQLTVGSTLTVTGNAFSVGSSTLVVSAGKIGIATVTPQGLLHVGAGTSPGLLVTAGGSVGIGTTGPASPLQIAGPSGDELTNGNLFIGDGSSAHLVIGWLSGGYSWMQSRDSKPLHINRLGNNVLLNAVGGNVGIGTDAPESLLHVSGGDISIDSGFNLFGKDSAGAQRALIGTVGDDAFVGSAGSGILLLSAGGAGLGRLTDNGSLGIGTTNPTARLHVSSANASALDTVLKVSSGSSAAQELLVVKGSGNVGIGTSSPGAKLDLSGQIRISGGSPADGKFLKATDSAGLAVWDTVPSGIQTSENLTWAGIQTWTSSATFQNAGFSIGVSTFVVKGGNVGIGKADPLRALDVNGFTVITNPNAGNANVLTLVSNADQANLDFVPNAGGSGTINNNSGGPLDFSVGNVPYMTIRADGKVGVGTTAPAVKLHVEGGILAASSVTAASFHGSASGLTGVTADTLADTVAASTLTAKTNLSGITVSTSLFVSAGNLGIGTTGPSGLLDVSGNAGTVVLQAADGGGGTSSSPVLRLRAKQTSGQSSMDFSLKHNISTAGTFWKSRLGIFDQLDQEMMSFSNDSSGSNPLIGIGTTNPQVKLHVQSSDMWLRHSVAGNTSTQFSIFNNNNQSVVYGIFGNMVSSNGMNLDESFIRLTGSPKLHVVDGAANQPRLTVVKASGNLGLGTTTPDARLDIQETSAASSYSLRVGTAATTYHLAVSTAGNVGIGTSNPQGRLHVSTGPGAANLFVSASSGYVGIGTNNLSNIIAPLVVTDSGADGTALFQNAHVGMSPGSINLDTVLYLQPQAGDSFVLNAAKTDGSGALVVLPDGKVGVGTENPSSLLHVSGGDLQVGDVSASTISASGFLTLARIGQPAPAAGRLYYDSSTSKLRLSQDGSTFVDLATGTVSGGGGDVSSAADNTFTGANTFTSSFTVRSGGRDITLSTSPTAGISSLFVGGASGNVGIGTTSPGSALSVSGQIRHALGIISDGVGNGSVAGNARGTGAIDLQTLRTLNTQVASGIYSVIGGGQRNTASSSYDIVGGGFSNTASGGQSTIGGGESNTASASHATVGGGQGNTASGAVYTTVGGGVGNIASASRATVGGGDSNTANGFWATVGGGQGNTASGTHATVPGGLSNQASGAWATVAGGESNAATNNWSFAAGHRAKANHQGAFIWGDSTDADFASTASNQFLIRAGGGVGISTNAPVGLFTVGSGTMVVTSAGNVGIGASNPGALAGGANSIGRFLHILGPDPAGGNGSNSQLILEARGNSPFALPVIQMISPDATATKRIATWFYHGGTNVVELQFRNEATNIPTQDDVIVFKNDGNVGIGTESPQGLLQVGGGTLTVKSGGNVGIGTTAPGRKLHLSESLSGTTGMLINNNDAANGISTVDFAEAGAVKVRVGYNGIGNKGLLQTETTEDLDLGTNQGVVMTLKGTGGQNVVINTGLGIGTTAPASKLHVSGGDLQVGDAFASTMSASGFLTLASTTTPTASRGRLYFDSGSNKLRLSQDGSTFVDLATGTVTSGGGSGGGYATTVVAAPTGVAATDTSSIQTAINNLPSGGGTVVLREGNYVLDASITFPAAKPVTLVGQGSGTSISLTTAFENTFPSVFINTTGNMEKITLRDFRFTGASRKAQFIDFSAGAGQTFSDLTFSNLVFVLAGNALNLGAFSGGVLQNVTISDCFFVDPSASIKIVQNAATVKGITISRTHTRKADGLSGIIVMNLEGSKINFVDNVIDNQGLGSGVAVSQGSLTPASELVIVGNTIASPLPISITSGRAITNSVISNNRLLVTGAGTLSLSAIGAISNSVIEGNTASHPIQLSVNAGSSGNVFADNKATVTDNSGQANAMISASGGNVGISTGTPTEKLHVAGNILSDFGVKAATVAFTGLGADPLNTTGMVYYNSSTNKLRLFNGAWVDIATGTVSAGGGGDASLSADNTFTGANVFESSFTVRSGGRDIILSTSATAGISSLFVGGASGNVGIGTSSPGAKLDIAGGAIQLANGQAVLGKGATSGTLGLIRAQPGQDVNIELGTGGSTEASNIRFLTGGTLRAFISAAGRLAINSVSPGEMLSIGGNSAIFLEGNNNASGFKLGYSDTVSALRLLATTTGSDTEVMRITKAGNVGISSASPQGLFVVGSGTMVVTAAGNVGIGTTNPAAKLDVQGGSGDSFIQLWRNSSGVIQSSMSATGVLYADGAGLRNLPTPSNTFVQDGNSFAGLATIGTNDNNALAFETNGTEKARIAADGKFVIGATIGTSLLHVSGDTASKRPSLRLTDAASPGATWEVSPFWNSGDGNAAIARISGSGNLLLAPNAGNVGVSTANPQGLFVVGNGTMVVTAAGNVGIGTASPAQKLEVNGTAQFGTGAFKSVFSAVGVLTFPSGYSPANSLDAASKGYVDGLIPADSGWTDDGTVVRLTSPGTDNVVIGSTLTVQGSAFSVGGSTLAVVSGNVGIATATPQGLLHVGAGATPGLLVTSGGNVGIGTPNPLAALQVSGQIRHTLGIISDGVGNGTDIGNARGTGAIDLQTFRGVPADVASGIYSVIGGGTANRASGSQATVGGGAGNKATGTQATVSGGITNTASGNQATIPGGENNIALGNYSLAAGQRAKANHTGTFVWADSTAVDFASTLADSFIIRASGGVGIGTASPAARLHVSGGDLQVGDSFASTISASGYLTLASTTTPAAAAGRIYFDSGTSKLRLSQDGSTFVDIATGTVSAGGGVGGSGTAGKLSKWTASATLADSIISDNGAGLVTIAGNLNPTGVLTVDSFAQSAIGRLKIRTDAVSPGSLSITVPFISGANMALGLNSAGTGEIRLNLEGGATGGVMWGNGSTAIGKLFSDGSITLGASDSPSTLGLGTRSLWAQGDGAVSGQTRLAFAFGAPGVIIGQSAVPTRKLDVRGDAVVDSSFTVRGSGFTGSQRIFDVAGSTLVVLASGNIGIATATPQGLLHVGAGTTPGLLVTSAGNVGIGTTAPGARLELGNGQLSVPSGTSSAPSYSFTGDLNLGLFRPFADRLGFVANEEANFYTPGGDEHASIRPFIGVGDFSSGILFGPTSGGVEGIGIGRLGSNILGFMTNSSERIRIEASGNVGIGTTAPASRLHVSGGDLQVGDSFASTISASGFLTLASTTTPTAAAGRLYFDSSTSKLRLSQDGSTFVDLATGTVTSGGGGSGGGYATVIVAAPTGVAATDTSNIQNAINSLPAGGGMVVLREGSYSINAQINLPSGKPVWVVGQGRSTVLLDGPFPTIFKAPTAGNMRGLTLSDFFLDSSVSGTGLLDASPGTGQVFEDIRITRVDGKSTFKHLNSINTTTNGIIRNVEISHCNFENANLIAFVSVSGAATAERISILNNKSINDINLAGAFILIGGDGHVIKGNQMKFSAGTIDQGAIAIRGGLRKALIQGNYVTYKGLLYFDTFIASPHLRDSVIADNVLDTNDPLILSSINLSNGELSNSVITGNRMTLAMKLPTSSPSGNNVIAGNYTGSITGGASTDALISASSGNVGIGTTAPAAKLDVGGTRTFQVDTSNASYLSLKTNGVEFARIKP